jgi:hypothetical protein
MEDYLEYYYYDYNIRRRRLLVCIAICVCMLWYKLQEHRFMRRPKYGSLLERDLEREKMSSFLAIRGCELAMYGDLLFCLSYSGNTCSISVFIVKIVYILLSSICTCIRLIEFSARRMWSMKTGSSFARIVGCSTLLLSNECFFYRLCLTVHGDG